MESRSFGKNKRGEDATLYTLRNSRGMVMTVSDYGATLHSLLIPVGNELRDVVLGYDNALGYDSPSGTYFGARHLKPCRYWCCFVRRYTMDGCVRLVGRMGGRLLQSHERKNGLWCPDNCVRRNG